MADIIIQGPDNKPYAFPAGTPREIMLEAMARQFPAPSMSLADMGSQAIQNIPGSAVQFGKGLYEAVTSPVKTAGAMLDIAAGGRGASSWTRQT